MKRLMAILAPALILAGCSQERDMDVKDACADAAADAISVVDPWVRAADAGRIATAAYFTVCNKTGEKNALVAIETDRAPRAELHETTHSPEGVAQMRQVEAFALDTGAPTVLAPGGGHVMLFEFEDALKEGEVIELTLVFENGERLKAQAPIRSAAAAAHH